MLIYRIFVPLIVLSFLLSSATCQENKQANDCEGVMCTMMFTMVTAEIRQPDGSPGSLDSTVTVGANGRNIPSSAGNTSAGMYVIIDDGYQKALANKTEKVTFRGFKNGAMVVEQEYEVKADCCHVAKVSGPAVISLK